MYTDISFMRYYNRITDLARRSVCFVRVLKSNAKNVWKDQNWRESSPTHEKPVYQFSVQKTNG